MNTKLGNKSPNIVKSKQWCTDIEAQRIIENREETIKFLADENKRLKREVIDLKLEIENIGPALKRQQETIIQLNEVLSKPKR